MRDVLSEITTWYREGTPFALATVVETWSSSPRTAGASMAVSASGEVVGSVSGGCVEGAVYELAQEVIATGVPARETYGVADDDAFAVGLTCGGTLDVFVELITSERLPWLLDVARAVEERRPVAVATVIGGAEGIGRHLLVTPDAVHGSAGNTSLDHGIRELAQGELALGRNAVVHVGRHGEQRMDEVTVFVESFAPSPEMIVFGAIDFAAAVVRVGKFLGYHVTVCDARPVFATRARFPEADEIVVGERALARLSSPIGLDLRGRTPEETAVSIAAEVIAGRWGGSGRPLTDLTTPIHA